MTSRNGHDLAHDDGYSDDDDKVVEFPAYKNHSGSSSGTSSGNSSRASSGNSSREQLQLNTSLGNLSLNRPEAIRSHTTQDQRHMHGSLAPSAPLRAGGDQRGSIPIQQQQNPKSPPFSAPTSVPSKPSASYLGMPGGLPANVQARIQAFQQSRQSRSNSASNGNPLGPSSPLQQHKISDLSRSPSSGSGSSIPSYNNSSTTSPVLSPLGDQTKQQQHHHHQQQQPPQQHNQHQNGSHSAPPQTPSNSNNATGATAVAAAAAAAAANNGQGFTGGALFVTPSGTHLKKQSSLSARRNGPKISGLPGAPGAPVGPESSNKKLNKPTLPQLPKGSSTNLFTNYKKYVDVSTGRLNFAGKASLHSQGIRFMTGRKKQYNISLQDMEPLGELGRGNYGTVTRVLHKPTGVEMAMKEIRLELDEAKFTQIIMELEVLHNCNSPYVVDFYGAFFVEGAVYVCMEYMNGGSLDKIYQGGVPEPELAVITNAVVEGLHELKEKHNIIHRDVKPTNILVSSTGKIKLCDFGVSGKLVASIAKTNIGCQSYMAPERIQSNAPTNEYTVHSDVWSLGLSILETAKGSYPYPPETYGNIFSQLTAIVDGNPPQLSDDYSDLARDFVSQCLDKVPTRRPAYGKLLQHPWLSKYKPAEVDLGAFVRRAQERRAAGLVSDAPRPPLHNGRAGNR